MMLAILAAYLLGSFPSAVLVSHAVSGGDIRAFGDGNMGARNTTRSLGWKAGIMVAILDFGKGVIAVALARNLGASAGTQLLSVAAAVLGHDFPLWAHFRGGQGMATSLGGLMVLMPEPVLWGMVTFGSAFVLLRHFDLSAGLGLGLIVAMAGIQGQPGLRVALAALLFVSIGIKKWLDTNRQSANLPWNSGKHI